MKDKEIKRRPMKAKARFIVECMSRSAQIRFLEALYGAKNMKGVYIIEEKK